MTRKEDDECPICGRTFCPFHTNARTEDSDLLAFVIFILVIGFVIWIVGV